MPGNRDGGVVAAAITDRSVQAHLDELESFELDDASLETALRAMLNVAPPRSEVVRE